MKFFGSRAPASGSGISAAITSLAQLAAVATVGTAPGASGSILSWVQASDGAFQVWQLRASTEVTDAGAVQRPDDYAAATNEKVWFRCN